MTRSSLDMSRKPVDLPLAPDEEVVRRCTASYDVGTSLSSTWRLGNFYLTNKRLLFLQVRKIIFAICLRDIKEIDIVKRRWILGKQVKQLSILRESGGNRRVHIAIKDPEKWKEEIEDSKKGVRIIKWAQGKKGSTRRG